MIDFPLQVDLPNGQRFLELGIEKFSELCKYVCELPMVELSNPSDFQLTLIEKRGTAASKHGFLAEILDVYGHREENLMIGIYLLSAELEPDLAAILDELGVKSIPSVQVYFRDEQGRVSFLHPAYSIQKLERFIIREQRCEPQQLVEWRPAIHRDFVTRWTKRQGISASVEAILKAAASCEKLICEKL